MSHQLKGVGTARVSPYCGNQLTDGFQTVTKFSTLSILIVLSLILVSCSSSSEPTAQEINTSSNEISYSIDWIIADNEVVAYRTAMNQMDGTDSAILSISTSYLPATIFLMM